MTEIEQQAVRILRDAGYFLYADDNNDSIAEVVERYGLDSALFSVSAGRAIALDAEDLADGGAGMAIQQLRALLARRGLHFEAADCDEYDDESHTTRLTVGEVGRVLFDWSFSRQPMPHDIAALDVEPALRDLFWKSRSQGVNLQARPCEHGAPGIDLHLQLTNTTRFLAHWAFGFDDGLVLHSVNFFTIANRVLAELGATDFLFAWQPFTNRQTGVLLDGELYTLLKQVGLAQHLRRIDSLNS